MIQIENKQNCCGCSACYNICPVQAIEMKEDEKGFIYPVIDSEKCINCNMCNKVCPILNKATIQAIPSAYAMRNRQEEVRINSSSGGIFTLIAEKIINDNGVVFGVQFSKKFRAEHICIDNINDLKKIRTSKYMQSTIGNTYKEAKQYLEKGRKVLFTGTPCQIEGLKGYLQKEYSNLYTQDIICHGVPSPKVHDKYLQYQSEKNYDEDIKKINHREKSNGWRNYSIKIDFKNKDIYKQSHNGDVFIKAFLSNLILRDSCYNCAFKKEKRISDITLADFWGIENILPELDDDKGTSLVIVNSTKGNELLEKIKQKTIYKNVNFYEAIKYNNSMLQSAIMPKNREKFFKSLEKAKFDKLVKKYVHKTSILKRVVHRIKRIIE